MNISITNHNFSEREMKLIEVLALSNAAFVNVQTHENQGMALNPLEKEPNHIFHYQFAWQKSLEPERYQKFETELTKRLTNLLSMAQLEEFEINFYQNSFMSKS
ncbi:hypothetical protein AJ85_05810 [Alkalihalobacillus alcalophilus ATCC 27647 = CGMCC 1.3604]|nr:hypothetical protein AJ85_05810 [Alkalihalobacillus alcalophilus ATCC 27647 = CGMCC 1.3604]